MDNLKTVKRKYKIQLALLGISILTTLVISFANVLPKHSIDYIIPTTITLIILMLLYSYILLLKNHIDQLNNEIVNLKNEPQKHQIFENKTLLSSGNYQFDSQFGFYKDKRNNELFCSPCLLKNIPAQLKESEEYWRCTNCGEWYYKPGHQPNNKKLKRGNAYNYVTDM